MGRLALPLACAAVAYNTQEFLRRYFFCVGRAVYGFKTDLLRYIGQLAAFVVLAQLIELDVRTVLWVMSACAIVAIVPYVRRFEPVGWERGHLHSTILRHWKFSKWLTFGSIITWASGSIYFVIAGALLGASAVGVLKATQTLLRVSNIVFFGFDNFAPVHAARHYHEDGATALTRYLWRLAAAVLVLTCGIAIATAVAPEFWLGIAFGSEYAGYGYLVQLWAVTYLILAFNIPLRAGLCAVERTKSIFVASLLSSLFAGASAYVLVAQFELIGVIVGILATYGIRNCSLAISLFRWLSGVR